MQQPLARIRRLRFQCGPQRTFEWVEPLLEMSPLIHAGPVDGLADLLGARGSHGALVLEEAQAFWLERKPAVVEQAPHLGLDIVDHLLVLNAMYACRQDCVE